MSVWRAPSVDEQPTVSIAQWAVYELLGGDRHLVGSIGIGEGRATSAIQKWNKQRRQITTRSGRLYTLVGPSGEPSGNASYVWNVWLRHNQITGETKNVSAEYEAA